MRRLIQVLAVILLLLTVLLCAAMVYLRNTEPIFTGGSILSVSRNEDPDVFTSWLAAAGTDWTPEDGTEDGARLILIRVDLKNPGPIPIEWIGITVEYGSEETVLYADNGPLALNAYEEGTLKALILSTSEQMGESRGVIVSGYRYGKKVVIRLVAEKNGIRAKGADEP